MGNRSSNATGAAAGRASASAPVIDLTEDEAPAPKRARLEAAQTPHAVNTDVIICGLERKPELNGAAARVQAWDAVSGRYTVAVLLLASGSKPAEADSLKALKPANVEPRGSAAAAAAVAAAQRAPGPSKQPAAARPPAAKSSGAGAVVIDLDDEAPTSPSKRQRHDRAAAGPAPSIGQ